MVLDRLERAVALVAAKKKKLSFADAARRAMRAHNPRHRFLETTGGSGPLVSFESVAIKAKKGRLRELVMLQKGLHGADWFRVNLYPIFEGSAASGAMEHTLWAGRTLGKNVSWKRDPELEASLDVACSSLEPSSKMFFTRFEKQLGKVDSLFGSLVTLYTQWLRAEGEAIPRGDFKDDDAGNLPAYESFRKSLLKKKLLTGVGGDIDTCLWRFWPATDRCAKSTMTLTTTMIARSAAPSCVA